METSTSERPPLFVTPIPITPTWAVTSTPQPSSRIIDKKNLDQLALLHQWEIENVYSYSSANFWFSDSNQFVLLNSDGVQSFKVDNLTRPWFLKSKTLDFTINEHDQIIINQTGLQIFDKQGVETRIIRTNQFCDVDEPASSFIVAIPQTGLVVTGQQDSYNDNDPIYDKARLLIWDISKDSCSDLITQFDGVLTSLSASFDGRYISYNVLIKSYPNPRKYTTYIYDLNLRKEKCNLIGGYNARFTSRGQLAIYDTREGTISLVSPTDCMTKLKFNVGTETIFAFAISPNGELLAAVTNHAIHFWDIQTGQKLREIGPEKYMIWVISFSPDGRFLVTAKRADSLIEKDKVMLWEIPEN